MYQKKQCVPKHKMIDRHVYEISIRASTKPKTVARSGPSSFSLFVLIGNIDKLLGKLCSYGILVDSPEFLNKSSNYSFVIQAKMFIDDLHRYKSTVENILDFFKFPFFRTDEFNIEVLPRSFESRYISPTDISYQDPFSDQPVYALLYVYKRKTGLCISHAGHLTTTVSPATLCPRIIIDKRSTKVVVSYLDLCFPDLDFCVKPSYFIESHDRSHVEVCVDQYFEGVNTALAKQVLSEEKVVSVVCLSVSSLGCIGTLVAYFVFDHGRHLHSMNIKALCFTMFLANTVYSLSGLAAGLDPSLCQIVGVFNHFLWLSVVAWMVLSSITTFRAFTTFRMETNQRVGKRFLCNALCSLVFPSSMVVLNILFSFFIFEDSNLGYSQYTCYIASSEMIMYTFAVPLAGMLILNIFLILITFREIRMTDGSFPEKVRHERHMRAIFLRLSSVSGASWIFGFLNMIVQSHVFSYLHILTTGSQGLYLFFAFGCQLIFRDIKTKQDTTKTESKTKQGTTNRP